MAYSIEYVEVRGDGEMKEEAVVKVFSDEDLFSFFAEHVAKAVAVECARVFLDAVGSLTYARAELSVRVHTRQLDGCELFMMCMAPDGEKDITEHCEGLQDHWNRIRGGSASFNSIRSLMELIQLEIPLRQPTPEEFGDAVVRHMMESEEDIVGWGVSWP